MIPRLTRFYTGDKGQKRLAAVQRLIENKVLKGVRKGEKIVIWTSLPGVTGAEVCPFSDNQRPPYGNGSLDRLVIVHCFDMTREPAALMAEACRMVREHGCIEVLGWTKPKYDPHLPVMAASRRRVALNFLDPWSLKWRHYEKVQNLLTLTIDKNSGKARVSETPATAMPCARSAVADR